MKELVQNVLQHRFSSLLGLLFIGFGLYTGVSAKQSWTDSSAIIASGAVMLGLKDPFQKTTK